MPAPQPSPGGTCDPCTRPYPLRGPIAPGGRSDGFHEADLRPCGHAGVPTELRGLSAVSRSPSFEGRFGRMFRNLPPLLPDDKDLEALARQMVEPEPTGEEDTAGDNPDIPAGFTYFGQFVDHDLTFDPTSQLERDNDPDALVDFRTPRFAPSPFYRPL